jgi:hypothetical protein
MLKIALLLLLCATPVFAQDMPTSHRIALGTYVGSAALDYHSTYKVLADGGYEKNPLGKLTDSHPVGTVVLGAAVDVTATTLLYKWLGKRHPKLTTALLFGVSSVRLSLAVHNYHTPGVIIRPQYAQSVGP